MQTVFSIVMVVVVILFFLANPKNKINQWFSLAVFLGWFGIIKQAIKFEIIPILESALGLSGLDGRFAPIHSIFTWTTYTLLMPTVLIAGFYFSAINILNLKNMRFFKFAIYIPGLILLFFFTPIRFGEYQMNSSLFWIVYAAYNFCFGIIFTFIVIKGIRREKSVVSKKQKQRVILVFLPPVCYWLISIFVPRLFDIFYPFDLESNIFELWQANIIITLIGIFIFIVVAFKDGFMGLKLVSQRYNWDSNMGLINMSAEYTSHMFKQQASIMELCINQLKEHYISADSDEEVHERLDILSRSVSTLTGFVDRIKRHSQIIQLTEGSYRITDLLSYSTSLAKDSGISIRIMIPENLFLICDKIHMTEVFANITKNAIEAIHENGIIEISGLSERSKYRLMFKDNGAGIDDDKLQNVFMPHFSTKKNTEKNFGLGLYYCKNVIIKHGGSISAESIKGKETTIIISFSAKRVVMSGEPEFSAVSKALTSISLEMRGNDG